MGNILKDEIGNTYGKWVVISKVKSHTSSAAWLCRCKCGHEMSILGANLRRNKLPLCTNCCRVCNKARGETEFKGNKRICKECDRKRIREWKEGNADHKEKMKNWVGRNPEAVDRYKQNERTRVQSSFEFFLYFKYQDLVRKHKRLNRNLDYRGLQKAKSPERRIITITLEEVLALWNSRGGLCAISGMLMLHEFKNPRTVSIDRIDSEKGYTPGNVQLVCQWVNFAKNSFSDKDIREVLQEFKES